MSESMSVSFHVSAACLFLAPVIAFGGINTAPAPSSTAEAPRTEALTTAAGFQLVQLPAGGDEKAGAMPPLRAQVQVGTQQRRIADTYRKQMEINPKIVIEGLVKGRPIPELEAVMIIVTMDTRAKYVNRREVYRVESAQTVPIPAVDNGARREFRFDSSMVSFDSWRDQTNVGGATYKYYVFGLRDPQTKAIIDFQTNNPQLASLGKSNPERREDFLNLSKGADFPSTIK